MEDEILYLKKPLLLAKQDRLAKQQLMKANKAAAVAISNGNVNYPFQCCPTYETSFAPILGMTRQGRMLKLMPIVMTSGGGQSQIFNAIYCMPQIDNKPCRYIDDKIQPISRCVQQYAYEQAIIEAEDDHHYPITPAAAAARVGMRDTFGLVVTVVGGGGGEQHDVYIDYIRVPSGCKCEIGFESAS